jgi:hypothetical protein
VGLRGKAVATPAADIQWDDLETTHRGLSTAQRARPLDDVLQAFAHSYQNILATVKSITQDDLFARARYAGAGGAALADFVAAYTYEGYDWAKTHIRRWRKTHSGQYLDKAKIVERIVVERRRLEQNLVSLSADAMVQPGVIGEWSVKDILAHLTDWEQRFLGWYEAGLRGEVPRTPAPGLGWGDLHILNQQIFEKHRHQSLDDVLPEFRTSYERVLATVKEISEEDIFTVGRYEWLGRENLAGDILANTANH